MDGETAERAVQGEPPPPELPPADEHQEEHRQTRDPSCSASVA
jgi:hypothetical protein